MSKWAVQLVIGKLLTDQEFRLGFSERGRECLIELRQRGIDLNDMEVTALLEPAPELWAAMAAQIDRRLTTQGGGPSRHRQQPLTPRQQRVLHAVLAGLTNKQIAADLGVSEGAVKATLQHVFRKIHVRTRVQLLRAAIDPAAAESDWK